MQIVGIATKIKLFTRPGAIFECTKHALSIMQERYHIFKFCQVDWRDESNRKESLITSLSILDKIINIKAPMRLWNCASMSRGFCWEKLIIINTLVGSEESRDKIMIYRLRYDAIHYRDRTRIYIDINVSKARYIDYKPSYKNDMSWKALIPIIVQWLTKLHYRLDDDSKQNAEKHIFQK